MHEQNLVFFAEIANRLSVVCLKAIHCLFRISYHKRRGIHMQVNNIKVHDMFLFLGYDVQYYQHI